MYDILITYFGLQLIEIKSILSKYKVCILIVSFNKNWTI